MNEYVYVSALSCELEDKHEMRIYLIYQYVPNMNSFGILCLSLGISDFVSAGVSATCDCVLR